MTKTQTKKIGEHDFCEVITDNLEVDGFPRGSILYVLSVRETPIKEINMYTRTVKDLIWVHAVEDKHVILDKGIFIVDPDNLKKLSKAKQRKLHNVFQEDFGDD